MTSPPPPSPSPPSNETATPEHPAEVVACSSSEAPIDRCTCGDALVDADDGGGKAVPADDDASPPLASSTRDPPDDRDVVVDSTCCAPRTPHEVDNRRRRSRDDPRRPPPERPTYRSKKPLWWRRLSGRGTKGQRKCIVRMTERGYCFGGTGHYGVVLDLERLFDDDPSEGGAAEDDRTTTSVGGGGAPDGALGAVDADGRVPDPGGPPPTQPRRPIGKDVVLELGFGTGSNLLRNARLRPNVNFVGADVHKPGVGVTLSKMEQAMKHGRYPDSEEDEEDLVYSEEAVERLYGAGSAREEERSESNRDDSRGVENARSNRTGSTTCPDVIETPSDRRRPTPTTTSRTVVATKTPYSNVRIYPGDGIKLLKSIPSDSLTSVLITFPDPWPNDSRSEFRVVQVDTVREMHRVLKKKKKCRGGTSTEGGDKMDEMGGGSSSAAEEETAAAGRFYLATDAETFADWTTEVFAKFRADRRDDDDESVEWKEIVPCPDRDEWLPSISKYEEKGLREGRRTRLRCWEAI